ncbi:hypothetical protein OpiT1DRAFT_00582 [Opitutaceae bacterium TAV1]|nr:hypothetical protein OpiT1DRAFT_00582 [Opitutaceae bacterium TAV1]
MKTKSLLLCVLLASACGAETPDSHVSYKSFFGLSKSEAETKAAALAKSDFESGIYRILVFGLRPAPEHDTYAKHLKSYGIECHAIAGCIVSDGILGTAKGYNEVMKLLLVKKIGKDVFAEYEQRNK